VSLISHSTQNRSLQRLVFLDNHQSLALVITINLKQTIKSTTKNTQSHKRNKLKPGKEKYVKYTKYPKLNLKQDVLQRIIEKAIR